jgi:hypothetical protein
VLAIHGPAPGIGDRTAAYRRRADELLTADEQDAVIDLIAYEPRPAVISSPVPAACARFAPGVAAAASVAAHG